MLLQHIGKIDRPTEVVIFFHICTFGVFQIFSIYQNLRSLFDIGAKNKFLLILLFNFYRQQ